MNVNEVVLSLFLDPSITVTPITESSVKIGDLDVVFVDLNDQANLDRLETRQEALEPGKIVIYSNELLGRGRQWGAFLMARSGLFGSRVGGRECKIAKLSKHDGSAFLDANHIQGGNQHSLYYVGLLYGDELAGVASLGRHHRQVSQNRIVLDRMCFKAGLQVVGGASKLLKACVGWATDNRYDEILSFSDNRWSDGGVYRSLGFSLEERCRSDYFYVRDGEILTKQSQKKSRTKCPDGMTELEWSRYNGLRRVYEFGKNRWTLNLRPGEHDTWLQRRSQSTAKQHSLGLFKHAHIRGYFNSKKLGASVYYGSSYELRCLYLLDDDQSVTKFSRCEAFRDSDGLWRSPDLRVDYVDGRSEIIEVKPETMLKNHFVQKQIAESTIFASKSGVGFRLWTEANSGLGSDYKIIEWAKKYLAESSGDTQWIERQKTIRKNIRRRYYDRHIVSDKVEVVCGFCNTNHSVLRKSYDANMARNSRYICEREGGKIAGSRPKDHLKVTNPHAAEGKKECSKCHDIKAMVGGFDIRKASWDGVSAKCKVCTSKDNEARYLLKLEKDGKTKLRELRKSTRE